MGNSSTNRRLVLAGLICLGAGVSVPAFAAQCTPDRVTITGPFGTAAFNIDVADTDALRARGLMHVQNMPLSRGMLFVYDRAQPLSFWMRNTLIELDMLFIDRAGVVQHIHDRAQPLDETPISPGAIPLVGVLEINGGLAARLGIEKGAVVHHPAFASINDPAVCN